MKPRTRMRLGITILGLILLSQGRLAAQGTAFTYQGQLFDNTSLANGYYALRFTLYDDSNSLTVLGGPITNGPVAISNGLFSVQLDFGPGQFTGPPRWLQIDAASNSVSPLYQPISATSATHPRALRDFCGQRQQSVRDVAGVAIERAGQQQPIGQQRHHHQSRRWLERRRPRCPRRFFDFEQHGRAFG